MLSSETANRRSAGFRNGPVALAAGLLFAFMIQPSIIQAQAVTFAGTKSTVAQGLFSSSSDSLGNLWVTNWLARQLTKYSVDGTNTTINLGFSPRGLAIDDAGNAFVLNQSSGSLVRVAPSGQQTVVATNMPEPHSVARDSSGVLYVATINDLWKISADGQATRLGAALGVPFVAVDNTNQPYVVTQQGRPGLYKVEANGSLTQVVSLSGFPSGLAIDPAGNKYIPLQSDGSVIRIAPDGATSTVASGLTTPIGVSSNQNGELFVSEFGGAQRLTKISTSSVHFSKTNVCAAGGTSPSPCSQTFDLEYNVTITGTLGPVKVLTEGIQNLDFTQASNTCTGTLTAGSSCKVSVVFAPRSPGLRRGAVQLTNAGGSVLATTYISGVGVGPRISFAPAATGVIVPGLNSMAGLAADAAGNLFVVNNAVSGSVVKVTPGGQQSAIAPASRASGVAVDGAGNVYVGETGANRVRKIAPDGAQSFPATGIAASGVAVDGAGNLFVTDVSANTLVKVRPDGSATVLASDLQAPYSVATDATGNAYVADALGDRIVKFSPAGVPTTVANIEQPVFLAIDPAGNMFITSAYGLVRVAPDGTATPVFSNPALRGVALNGSGDLYTASIDTLRITKYEFAAPPALTFPSTSIGSASVPQSLPVDNTGNAALSVSSLAVGTNFEQVAGSAADCAPGSIEPGRGCTLSIRFKPTAAGALQSTAVLTSNALNANPATHTVSLSGVGEKASQTITFEPISAQTVGDNVPLSASSNSGLAVSFASTTPAVCTVSGATVTMLTAGACTIQATQPGNETYNAATPVPQTFVVDRKTQTITFTGLPSSAAFGSAGPYTLNASASSGLAVAYSVTGPASLSGSTLTITGGGSVAVTASQAGNTGYSAATPVTLTIAIGKGASTTALAASNTSPSVGQAVQLTATVTAAGQRSGDVVFLSGGTTLCTVAVNASGVAACSFTPSAPGAITITAQYQGDVRFSPSTATIQLSVQAPATAITLKLVDTTLVYPVPPVFEVTIPVSGSNNPTGTVKIYAGARLLGTYPVLSILRGRVYGLTLPSLEAGTHVLTASYSGDSNYAPGTSAPVSVTVARADVDLRVSCADTNLRNGQSLSCSVTATTQRVLPVTGKISYRVDNGAPVSVDLKLGIALINVNKPAKGQHALVVSYAQQASYNSPAPVSVTFTVK